MGVLASSFFASRTCASAADVAPNAAFEYLVSSGDVYGPLTNDGGERAGSYGARLRYDAGGWRVAYDFRRSVYTTENTGPGSFTQFPVLGGGFRSVPFFDAVEATSQFALERQLGRSRLYAGVGYFLATTNYAYPHLGGLGIVVSRAPDPGRGVKGFASLAYHRVSGSFQGSSGRFGVATADLGLAYRPGRGDIALLAGYTNELREPLGMSSLHLFDRSLPYVGLSLRR